MKLLSTQEAIAVAKWELGIEETTEHDSYLTFFADEAVRHLDNNDNKVVRTTELEVQDGNKVCLPDGFQTLVGFAHSESDCMCIDFSIGPHKCRDYFKIEGLWLIFNHPVDYETVWVAYEALGRDCDGFALMTEQQERSVRAYVRWRYKQKYPQQFQGNPWIVDQREWTVQKAYCAGMTALREFRENKAAIAQIMNGTKLKVWGGRGYVF